MKCPYCGAEVRGRYCEYCGSEIKPEVRSEAADDVSKPEFATVTSLCRKFLKLTDVAEESYTGLLSAPVDTRILEKHKIHPRIMKVLEIPEEDSVFLIHDDTMFHSGKNGFAITTSGIYTKSLTEEPLHITWEQFAETKFLTRNNSSIVADGTEISYDTDKKEVQDALLQLEQKILEMFRAYGKEALKWRKDLIGKVR